MLDCIFFYCKASGTLVFLKLTKTPGFCQCAAEKESCCKDIYLFHAINPHAKRQVCTKRLVIKALIGVTRLFDATQYFSTIKVRNTRNSSYIHLAST